MHVGAGLELVGSPVVTGMSLLPARRAGMDLTDHRAIGLLRRPNLDGVAVGTTDWIWPLHDERFLL